MEFLVRLALPTRKIFFYDQSTQFGSDWCLLSVFEMPRALTRTFLRGYRLESLSIKLILGKFKKIYDKNAKKTIKPTHIFFKFRIRTFDFQTIF